MNTSLVESKTGVSGAPTTLERAAPVDSGSRLARWSEPVGGTRIVGAAISGLFVTGLWIALFTVGLSVPSQPFRDGLLAIEAATPPPNAHMISGPMDALYALTVVCFAYTPTNLAVLCCLASLIGCLGYAATHNGGSAEAASEPHGEESAAGGYVAGSGKNEPTKAPLSLRPAISAVTWGFFIYLFLISGTLVAMENPFASTTPEQYLRLAGTASLLAFVVGWQPEVLTRLVSQVGQARIGSKGGASK